MKWARLKRTKIRVKGKPLKMMMKGMTAQEEHTHFLQGLLTNDVRSLKPYTFNYNLWLKKNGAPIGDFFVYRFPEDYLLDTELPPDTVLEEFERLKLSLRVEFQDLTPSSPHYFIFGDGVGEYMRERLERELREGEFLTLDGVIIARNSLRFGTEGYDLIGKGAEEFLAGEEVSWEDTEALRIRNCVPRIGKELREGFSPLEACLLNKAISLTKGCYVGQEAVARVHFRGRTPRVLVRFSYEGDLREGDEILSGDKRVGLVTSVSPRENRALGYLLRSSLEEGQLKTRGAKLILDGVCCKE
ncbi:MAG: folate-binding protein YgfZ [Aquificae bacterium]|nr:folate-binding protein YgfZ [Aquificota bacterium]